MSSDRTDTPFPVAYLLVLAFQAPVWLCAGLLWGALMVAGGIPPANFLVGALGFSFLMWVSVGNLIAFGLAWRRSAALPAADRQAVRSALERVCGKLRLVVLAESPDEVVLGPKRALVRFRLQEVRVYFEGGAATLTAPALVFGVVKKAIGRALAEAPAGAGSFGGWVALPGPLHGTRWCWLATPAVVGGLALLALCWTHRVWSVNEWRVYQAMDQECHSVWRDFHYGRIRAGDAVEEVIARTEPVRVKRIGPWVVLKYHGGGGGLWFTGLTAVAYDGQMIGAYAWSDTWTRQFFDIMSEEQRTEFFAEHYDQLARVGNAIFVK